MKKKADQKKSFHRQVLSLFGITFLLGYTLFSRDIPFSHSLPATPKSFGQAVWMHADTFERTDTGTLQNLGYFLRLQGIQKIILLGKNIDGTVPYPSKVAIKSTQSDTMKNLVAEFKKQALQVYFYFPVNTDPLWIQNHPEDIGYQIGPSSPSDIQPDLEKKLVNLTSQSYTAYISQLCVEAIEKFSLDGVQLDYIRYRNGQHGFSVNEKQRALKKGVDIDKIQILTYQTFVKPGDWKTLLQAYDRKDSDVLGWAKAREDIISEFVSTIKQAIRSKTRASIGVTLVSSGATAEAYTAVHFGQKWERLSALVDFATPMAYHGTDPDPAGYVSRICAGTLQKIHPNCAVSIGLQAHATSSEKLQEVVQTVVNKQLTYVLFRVGTFALSHMEMVPIDSNSMQLQFSWLNGCENQSLTALSLENTGSALETDPPSSILKWTLPHQSDTGETGVMSVHLTTNWNRATQSCLPLLLLHTRSAAVPTLQHTSWKATHLLYSIPTQTCEINSVQTTPSFLKVQEGQTWLHLDKLPSNLSIQIQKKEEEYAVWNQQNGIRIRYFPDYVSLQKRVQSTWMEPEILSIYAEPGWLPAKPFLQFFQFQTAYNEAKKQVHFFRWLPVLSSSLSISCQSPLEESSLFLTDGPVWVEWEEYFQTSFYPFTKKVHASGRQVVLCLSNVKNNRNQPETDWFMMQVAMKRDDTPDDYLFWLASNESIPLNPKNRVCIIPSNGNTETMDTQKYLKVRWSQHQLFPENTTHPLLWVQYREDSAVELETLMKLYDRKNQASIVRWQNKKRFEK